MLDEPEVSTNSTPAVSDTSSNADLPSPPRGRRSASRPAGPPKAAVADPLPSDPAFEAELQARMHAQLGATLATEPASADSTTPESPEPSPAKPARKRAPRKKVAEETGEAAPRRRTRKRASAEATPVLDAAAPEDVTAALAEALAGVTTAAEPETPVTTEATPDLDPSPALADVEQTGDPESTEQLQAAEAPDGSHNADDAARGDALAGEGSAADDTESESPEDLGESSAEEPAAEAEEVAAEDSATESSEAGASDAGDSDAEEADSEDGDEDADDQATGRRRRRRRGGRRRRRGSSGDADDASDNAESEDEAGDADSADAEGAEGSDETDDEAGADDNGEAGGTGRRRRRRRRRRGEDTGGEDDPDTDVVVKVREPRRSKAADEVTGIEGSTRMEAKRQRRREGRAAGRRRTPILSESEFLSRRESVQRTMVIRQNSELSQIAVLEDNVLVEHYVDRASATSLIGNVYLGRIQNVLPSMEAAFIDIGRGRNAVLYAGEVDWDSFGAEGSQRKVENVLKSGQTILVQVTKDPVGAKGARLTNNISLPGRYIVYSPGGHLSGISRKLPDTERKRLKGILSELVGEDASVIVRTAAEGATEEELVRDVNRLKAQWEGIEKKVKGGVAPAQLYAEPDATVRIVRDLFTEDFGKLIVHGNGEQNDAYDTINAYVTHVAPHLAERLERWDESRGDVFAVHRVDEQIAKALERKVYLPSGGSLIIDRTEAMTVIDVNTGKFTGSGGNLEATVTSNNLEAAEEVVRQLRLRDIGGIIVIDFIDMVLPSNRELLLRRLVECLGRDRTRHQVAEVTSLGLVQMTRKKIGTGLAEAFTEPCDVCRGRGFLTHDMPVESQSQADGGERRGGRRSRGRGGNSNVPDTAEDSAGNI